MTNKKLSGGFTILELLITLSVLSFIALLSIQAERKKLAEDEARFIGQQLSIYNNAVRNHISVNLDNETYLDNIKTTRVGVNWLKNSAQCSGGELSDGYFLPCEFPEFIGKSELTYTTTIYANIGDGKLRAKTVIDVKSADGTSTEIDSTKLGLAMLTANGGRQNDLVNLDSEDTTIQFDSDGNPTTNILVNGSDNKFLYCPFKVSPAFLNPECSTDGGSIEDGLLVMIAETAGDGDSLLRVDGSNTMNSSLRMEATEAARREIVGTSAVYNVTGEILKLGNSGVYYEGGWLPVIGDGLVIDTDLNIVGNSVVKGDIENSGSIYTEGNLLSDNGLLSGRDIIVEEDSEVSGNQYILGDANYNDNVAVFGTIDSTILNASTFLDANDISATNSVSSDVIVNGPIVRASAAMYSDGDMVISNDAIISGDSFVGQDRAVTGSIIGEGDIIADKGTSYLGNVFASAIFDPDGDYLIDPNGISRTYITRSEKIISSTSGTKLGLNANKILFARESIECESAVEDCATSVGGYVDMENVKIKSPGTGEWVSFIETLNGLENYVREQNGSN